MKEFPIPSQWLTKVIHHGLAIPAHPLALTSERQLDERRQRALARYYHAAGAGGIAVGVHTTQFAIHTNGMLEPVLQLAAQTIAECDAATGRHTVLVAGAVGDTAQAVAGAELAYELGYDAVLLSLAGMPEATDVQLIEHCASVAEVLPLIGFYLQPAVGGRVLSTDFWAHFASIPDVVAIKIAPFNRYHTLDVIKGVAQSYRGDQVALYTGNDDTIVSDLLTRFKVPDRNGNPVQRQIAGGLLGHWACWTQKAVELLQMIQHVREHEQIPAEILTLATQVTDCNGAFFDSAHNYKGCIAGINEVLRRQGLLENCLCLDPTEGLSPGQADEITRVWQAYPHLNDDAFVSEHLDEWLR